MPKLKKYGFRFDKINKELQIREDNDELFNMLKLQRDVLKGDKDAIAAAKYMRGKLRTALKQQIKINKIQLENETSDLRKGLLESTIRSAEKDLENLNDEARYARHIVNIVSRKYNPWESMKYTSIEDKEKQLRDNYYAALATGFSTRSYGTIDSEDFEALKTALMGLYGIDLEDSVINDTIDRKYVKGKQELYMSLDSVFTRYQSMLQSDVDQGRFGLSELEYLMNIPHLGIKVDPQEFEYLRGSSEMQRMQEVGDKVIAKQMGYTK